MSWTPLKEVGYCKFYEWSDRHILLSLYAAYIQPHLEYCVCVCVVWGVFKLPSQGCAEVYFGLLQAVVIIATLSLGLGQNLIFFFKLPFFSNNHSSLIYPIIKRKLPIILKKI